MGKSCVSRSAPSPAFGRYFPTSGEELRFKVSPVPRLRRVVPHEWGRVSQNKRGGACSGHRLDREGHRVTRLWFIRAALRPLPPLGGQPLRYLSVVPDGERIASSLRRTD